MVGVITHGFVLNSEGLCGRNVVGIAWRAADAWCQWPDSGDVEMLCCYLRCSSIKACFELHQQLVKSTCEYCVLTRHG